MTPFFDLPLIPFLARKLSLITFSFYVSVDPCHLCKTPGVCYQNFETVVINESLVQNIEHFLIEHINITETTHMYGQQNYLWFRPLPKTLRLQ